MSRLVQIDQRELDALRRVVNAARHVLATTETKDYRVQLGERVRRMNAAYADLRVAVDRVKA